MVVCYLINLCPLLFASVFNSLSKISETCYISFCGVAYDENRCGPIRIRKCKDTNKLLTIRLYSCKIMGKVAFAAISLHKLHAYVFNILTFLLKDNSSVCYFQKLNIYYFMSAHFKYSLALFIVGNKIIMIVILLNIEK